MATNDSARRDKSPTPPGPRPRRRHRLRRILLLVLILLVAAFWAAPMAMSTGLGRRLAEDAVNDRIKGSMGLGGLSLSWLGPVKLSDVTIHDVQGRQVLHVERITLQSGILGLLSDWEDFGRIELASPDIRVYSNPQGQVSIGEALESREPSAPKPPGRLPQPRGSVTISGGRVWITREGRPRFSANDIQLRLDLAGLDDVSGQMSLKAAGGGSLTGEFSLKGLSTSEMTGSVKFATPQAVSLQPLLGCLADDPGTAGLVKSEVTVTADRGTTSVKFAIGLSGLRSGRPDWPDVQPIDLALTGDLTRSADRIKGKAEITGEAAEVQVTYDLPGEKALSTIAWGNLPALIFGGQEGTILPELSLDLNGQVLVDRLAAAVPKLLQVVPGTTVQAGALRLQDLSIRGGQVCKVTGGITLADLRASTVERDVTCRPVSLTLDVEASGASGLNVRAAKLASAFAEIDAGGTARELRAKAVLDLAEFHKDIGALFDLAASVPSGKVTTTASLQRPAKDQADFLVSAGLENLTLRRGDKSLTLASGTVQQEGRLILSEGRIGEVQITEGQVSLGDDLAAGMTGQWNAQKGTVTGTLAISRADLRGLWRRLRGLTDVGPYEPAGSVSGTVAVSMALPDRLDFDAQLSGQGFRCARGERAADFGAAAVHLAGSVSLEEGRLRQVQAKQADLSVGRAVSLAGTGWCEPASGAFQAEGQLAAKDLGVLQQWAEVFQPTVKGRWGGALELKASAQRPSGDGPILSSGSGTGRDLRLDGQTLSEGPISLAWKELQYDPGNGELALAAAEVKSTPLMFAADDVRLSGQPGLRAGGKARLSADLEPCMRVCRAVAGWKGTPDISGKMQWQGAAASTKDSAEVLGSATIDRLLLRQGPQQTLDLGAVTVTHEVRVDRNREQVALKRLEVGSRPLSLRLAGTIDRYRGDQALNLSGEYEGSWAELTALLHQFVPSLKDKVAVTGPTSGQIEITGPARQAEFRPVFRGMAGKTALGWSQADLWGVRLGKARFSPVLGDAQVQLPLAEVAALQGVVRLGGSIDFREEGAFYRLPGEAAVLENIRITRQLSEDLLTRFNPIFAEMTSVEGSITLQVEDLSLPLGQAIRRTGSGRGHLDLSRLEVRPAGLLGTLMQITGRRPAERHLVEVQGVDFQIAQGRVNYDNFTMVFPDAGGFDLKFHGSVGFDDTLDLAVSLPVSAALLERLGARLPGGDVAKALAGLRVDIPVTGSRLKPALDTSKVDLGALLRRAAANVAQEQTRDVLGDLLKESLPGPKPPKPEGPSKPPKEEPKQRKADPVDLLFDLIWPKESRRPDEGSD